MANFEYEINEDKNFIFDERGNTILALREVSWNGNAPKLELRRWRITSEGEEKADKGFTFLTEEGPNELTKVLVDEGYGDTKELLESIMKREDFDNSKYNLNTSEEQVIDKEEYFDPNNLVLEGEI